jgi:hypothetical protein
MGQFQVILVMPSYGLIPVPPHLRHLTILSPFLRVPFPSQFLHFCFFCPVFFHTQSSKVDRRSSRTFFKRSRAILLSPNDRSVTPLCFCKSVPLHVIVRLLHQRQGQAQRGPPQPRRQRPRAALPVSSCLKHGAHRWRSLNKFALHLNLRRISFCAGACAAVGPTRDARFAS